MYRLFSVWLLAIASLSLVEAQTARRNCAQGSYNRRAITALIDQNGSLNAEGQAFIRGVRCLMNNGWWNTQSQVHYQYSSTSHGVAAFLPWHRLFLLSVEEAMRQCTGDQSIYIPYWDAALNAQQLSSSPVFRAFGGDGRGRCIPDGPFANLLASVPNQHCVTRQFTFGRISSPPEVALGLGMSQQTFASFSSALEGSYHADVHEYVGGDMSQMYSSNDPLFLMHHANVDRLWWLWQRRSTANAQAYGPYPGQFATVNDIMQMGTLSRYIGNLPVSGILSADAWCYSYGNPTAPVPATSQVSTLPTTSSWSSTGATTGTNVQWVTVDQQFFNKRRLVKRGSRSPQSFQPTPYRIPSYGSPHNKNTPADDDVFDGYNLRHKTPISKQMIQMNRYNETLIRNIEQVANQYIDFVNSVDGYVSKCALVYQENPVYRELTDQEYQARLQIHGMLFEQFKLKSNITAVTDLIHC